MTVVNDHNSRDSVELVKLIACFITSFKISHNDFIYRKKLIKEKFERVFINDKNIKVETYVSKENVSDYEHNPLVKDFLFHISNSLQSSLYGTGLVEIVDIETPASISHTANIDIIKRKDSSFYEVLSLKGTLTNIILYTEDFITTFTFFSTTENTNYQLSLLSSFQHERHLHIKQESGEHSNESMAINSYKETPYDKTIMQLTFDLISERLRDKALNFENFLNENYRGRTYTSIGVEINISDLNLITPYIPVVVTGYSNFLVKNPEKFVEEMDLSMTDDLKMFLTDKVYVLIKRFSSVSESKRMRDSVEDFVSFGAITGLIETYLNLFQHEHFELLNKIKSKRVSYREMSYRLNSIVSISSTISDPNFIETPLLKRMVRYLIQKYEYEEFYKSLRDTLDIILANRTQRLIIYLTAVVIVVGILSATLFILRNF